MAWWPLLLFWTAFWATCVIGANLINVTLLANDASLQYSGSWMNEGGAYQFTSSTGDSVSLSFQGASLADLKVLALCVREGRLQR